MSLFDKIMNAFGYEKAKGNLTYRVGTGMRDHGILGQQNRRDVYKYLNQYADAAWVYACVYRIATKGAGVPLRLYRKKKSQGKIAFDEIHEHEILTMIEKANPIMDGFDLFEATYSYLELSGNAYWLLDNIQQGKPTEIYPLNPSRVKIKTHPTEHVDHYIYDVGDRNPIKIEKEFILHFKYFNPTDDFYGLSPLSAARVAVDSQTYGDEYNRNFFLNSAAPDGALVVPKEYGKLDEDTKNRVIAQWKSRHGTYAKAHNTAIFEGGLEWKAIGLSQKDMDFIQSKKMTREDILGTFGIPPSLVGIFEYANYANAKEQRRIFWQDTMTPKFRKIENVINSFLVKIIDESLYLEYDLTGIEALKEDEKMRAEIDEIETRSGVKTINEIREAKGLKRVAWGDTWNAPINLIPITSPRPEPVAGNGNNGSDEGKGMSIKNDTHGMSPNFSEGSVSNAVVIIPPDRKEDSPGIPEDEAEAKKAREKEIRDKLWALFRDFTEDKERKFKRLARGFFNDQEKETIANLREHGIKRLKAEIFSVKRENINQKLDVIIFDSKKHKKIMRKGTKPLIREIVDEKGRREIANIGIDMLFDVDNSRVVEWIEDKTFKFADEVNSTTIESLRKQLKEGITEGESIPNIEKRIEGVFNIARGSRTEMIARTEVVGASNFANFEAYEQSGVVVGKVWITARDGRVRDSHLIDGEQVGKDELFSNGLLFPLDPQGDPGNVINCRCTIRGVVEGQTS